MVELADTMDSKSIARNGVPVRVRVWGFLRIDNVSKSSENVKRFRRNRKIKIIESMGGGCVICGYSKCKNVLELHHIDPTQKEVQISDLMKSPRKIFILLKELEKCVLLCANCHREVHAKVTELPEKYDKLNLKIFGYIKIDDIFVEIPKNITLKKEKVNRRKFETTFEELSELISKMSYVQIGKMFGVSDKAITKRVILLGIKLEPRNIFKFVDTK